MLSHYGWQENEFELSPKKGDLCSAGKKLKKLVFLILIFLVFITGIHAQDAQARFPNTEFWSLDAGLGITDILVEGKSFQFIIDPKLSISHAIMIGAKFGANYSHEEDDRNILTFETQAYIRWNFLRFGNKENTTNIFIQGGMGLLAAYRGNHENTSPFGDVTMTRGSLMFDAATGVTLPLTERWHIEPQLRAGYPHIVGLSVTAGYKFRLPQKIITEAEYHEVFRLMTISAVEFILFGPDIGRYNIGIDRDAQQLNELVLDYTAKFLKEHPNYVVRLEGHANPYTINRSEIDELMVLSAMRSNVVADQLRSRGVSDEQIIIVSFGGTRTATSEWDVRNRNRRVEMIVFQVEQQGRR